MAKAQILIVEDESIIAKDLQVNLQSLGYAVPLVASSGNEALKMVEESKPDLVLMDIVLQGEIDGIETARQIRSRFNIPVIYLTAYADEETLVQAKITEPFGYILKPYEDRELYTAIEIALHKSRIERELRESEEWLSTTLESIGDAVIATDKKGRVKFMNAIAQSLTACTEEEAIGKPLDEIFSVVHEKTKEHWENPVSKVLETGAAVGPCKHLILIARDGTERMVSPNGAPIRDRDGHIIGVVLVFRDITVCRKMEEELLKASKLESLGILTGGIAHDFNNILTAILLNISVAKTYTNPEDEVFKRLIAAEKASLRAKDLTQQLLTFSKGGAPVKKTASVVELIRDSAGFALRGSNVRCEFSIPENLWPVEVDEGQMSQVINNLMINAQQAMPQGGTIRVQAENKTIGIEGEQGLPLQEGRYIKLSIADEGIGIPKADLPKIFDPYFTTKQKGSGLGLATTYSIIKKHDGYIGVKSEPGVGTTFYIYLPASQSQIQTQKVQVRARSGIHPLASKGRILVMDDEESISEAIGEFLSSLGYKADLAKDGAEAIELYKRAKESGWPFDVVILDLTIPGGMGGKETIQKLLEIDPQVKAIVSSGYSNDLMMANFRQYGFSSVVAKPYNIEELSETLRRLIGHDVES